MLQQVLDVGQEGRRAAEVEPVALELPMNNLLQALFGQAAKVDLKIGLVMK